jgi:hypothetical protein
VGAVVTCRHCGQTYPVAPENVRRLMASSSMMLEETVLVDPEEASDPGPAAGVALVDMPPAQPAASESAGAEPGPEPVAPAQSPEPPPRRERRRPPRRRPAAPDVEALPVAALVPDDNVIPAPAEYVPAAPLVRKKRSSPVRRVVRQVFRIVCTAAAVTMLVLVLVAILYLHQHPDAQARIRRLMGGKPQIIPAEAPAPDGSPVPVADVTPAPASEAPGPAAAAPAATQP